MIGRALVSLLMIGVVAAVAGAGTLAYFSDTETSTGNTFTAGTIDLKVNDKNPLSGAIIAVEGKPSEVKNVTVKLENVGTNPGIKYIHFVRVVDTGGANPEPEQQADPNNLINDLSTQIEVDINGKYLDLNGDGKPDTLAQLISKKIKLPGNPLNPGEQNVEYDKISFHIKSAAGNEYQGDVSTFDVEFGLRQVNDPNADLIDPVYLP